MPRCYTKSGNVEKYEGDATYTAVLNKRIALDGSANMTETPIDSYGYYKFPVPNNHEIYPYPIISADGKVYYFSVHYHGITKHNITIQEKLELVVLYTFFFVVLLIMVVL